MFIFGKKMLTYVLLPLQEGRVYSRASEHLACRTSRPRRRATSRVPATSSVSATSPPATSPKRTTLLFAVAAATSRTVTWPSWSTPDGLIPAQSGSTRCPGVSGVCSILSRWIAVNGAACTAVISNISPSLCWFVPHKVSVWKPNDLCDWEWSLWEDDVYRAVWWLEDTVL